MMELVNELYAFCSGPALRAMIGTEMPRRRRRDRARRRRSSVLKEAVEALVLMLSPFTPHMAEELWEALGHAGGVVAAGWPAYRRGGRARPSRSSCRCRSTARSARG